ncbi:alpha/beta fold hydrolase [Microtetraspora fusca]|uniref:Alpha/beta fold hydrolase n=1 Tax=Microtetraspora fusca TaxID=1997 RepID=A0ABW6UYJ2_MICFU
MSSHVSVSSHPHSTSTPARLLRMIEVRSIDYIPSSERRGKAWHQAPFWFTGQLVVSTIIVGFIGPAQGLSVGLSILASALGALAGAFLMAFHANQGPTMGLPQMVQSRAQFGVKGAALPMLGAIFLYVGLSVFGVVLGGQAISLVLPGPPLMWGAGIVVLATLLAVVGHDLLHAVLRWLSYLVAPVFVVLTVLALVHLHPQPASGETNTPAAMLVQFVAAAGYLLGYAVYVSDYSRYLPASTSPRAVIGWTYLGAATSAIWLMSLGSFIASSVPVADALPNLRDIGDRLFPGFGTFAVVITLVPSAIALMGVNLYGTMLSGVSIAAGFRPIALSVRARVIGIVAGGACAFLVALAMPDAYLGAFNDFVTMVLYLLVPWSAVNLVDYYWVRRGRYAITALFDQNGIYGRWGVAGLVAYGLGFAAMIPFMSTGFFTGPAVPALGGADIAFAVGLLVAGGAYLVGNRGFHPSSERPAILASLRLLGEGANDGEHTADDVERRTVDTATGPLSVLLRRGDEGTTPVLFLHPANLSARCWRMVAERLPADRGWIALDLRGHGESTRSGTYDVEGWAEDCAHVLTSLGVPRAHLVGGSASAAVAVELAARHPDLAASVVTVGGAFRPVDPEEGGLIEEIVALGSDQALRRHAAAEAVAVPEAAEEAIADLSRNDDATTIAIWRAAAATDSEHAAATLRRPVLVVVGELDRTCPAEESTWFAEVTGARLEVLPGIGHLPMYEAPDDLASLLTEHLRRLS